MPENKNMAQSSF